MEILEKKDRFRLGYKPVNKVVQKTNQNKVCTLQETFHSDGYINEDHVAAVEEESEEMLNLVCHYLPDATLNNWKFVEILEMISSSKLFTVF